MSKGWGPVKAALISSPVPRAISGALALLVGHCSVHVIMEGVRQVRDAVAAAQTFSHNDNMHYRPGVRHYHPTLQSMSACQCVVNISTAHAV